MGAVAELDFEAEVLAEAARGSGVEEGGAAILPDDHWDARAAALFGGLADAAAHGL